jgi:hypothetical protein
VFNLQKLIQNHRLPLAFLIKSIEEAKGAWLGTINPLSRFSTRYFLTSSNSAVD